MRKIVLPLLLFILPVVLFAALAYTAWIASFQIAFPTTAPFKDNWPLFAFMGSAISGIGTLFIALAVGVSLVTYSSQLEQAKETSRQLLETALIQTSNLDVLQRQAAAALLTAQIQGLTSRLQGYEGQVGMVRARSSNSTSVERRTEENSDVSRMRGEQHKLYLQLDRILDDLKIGTKAEVPTEGTYSDPFAAA